VPNLSENRYCAKDNVSYGRMIVAMNWEEFGRKYGLIYVLSRHCLVGLSNTVKNFHSVQSMAKARFEPKTVNENQVVQIRSVEWIYCCDETALMQAAGKLTEYLVFVNW
jgi:hypothetical protein